MKKIFQKILAKFVKKAINKSVNDVASNPVVDTEVSDEEPVTAQGDNSKKDLWKFILQMLISILTAILTALGASSCVHSLM